MRELTWWQFLLIVLAYLAIIQVGGNLLSAGIDQSKALEEGSTFFRAGVLPLALSAAFAILVVSWLRWWPQVIHEKLRVQRWVRVVPIVLIGAALIGTSWVNLASQNADVVLALIALASLAGFTEELMFRGVGVVTFRRMGLSETRVALYSSLVFGAVHLSNALHTGSKALFQAAVVSLTGYFFYLTRRYAGAIWLAMIVHASQDFFLLSGQVGTSPKVWIGVGIVFPAMIGLGILVWVRRKRIELPASSH